MTMTRQEQLDAVVRNYGVWQGELNELAFCSGDTVVYMIGYVKIPVSRDGGFYGFTRSEVETRKAELQNKPSWDDAPERANYRAQDADGRWCWYNLEPHPVNDFREFRSADAVCVPATTGELIGDWRDTLEKRPESSTVDPRNGECIGGAEWDGEGLPPAGIECEYLHHVFGWTGCTTIGLFNGNMVCAPNRGGFYAGDSSMFRPIKSDREKFVESATSLYIDVKDDCRMPVDFDEIMGLMYDGLKSGRLPLPPHD